MLAILCTFVVKTMSERECINKLSKSLFWDIDIDKFDMHTCPEQIVQRTLEYGTMDDWLLVKDYYGLPRIVELCKKMRTLEPTCLSYICCISNTSKEEYRCYHTAQSNSTLWNS